MNSSRSAQNSNEHNSEQSQAAELDSEELEIANEQTKVSEFYRSLDLMRTYVDQRLAQAQSAIPTGTPSSIAEQEALVGSLMNRRKQLHGVDRRLCFGRLDTDQGETHYIGRLGLADTEQNPLLIDWRAAVAAPFYSATAVHPQGIARRRHIATEVRRVTSIDDDVLDLAAVERMGLNSVIGNDSLLTSLNRERTSHMHDIVATIQREQDQIIRTPARGTLVVQGGPGTGKTVVALHRIAFLLYQNRETIARQGALVIGPNPHFLEYIDKVLPALGETGVTLATIDQLVPGVTAAYDDAPEVAALKGSPNMAKILQSLVRSRQRIPAAAIPLELDGIQILLTPEAVSRAVRRARDTQKPHNEAWRIFAKDLLNQLAQQLATELGTGFDDITRKELIEDLRDNKDVRREINLCWMPQTPDKLLNRLFSQPALLAEVAPQLSSHEHELLLSNKRTAYEGWSASDIALLDELAELLGDFVGNDRLHREAKPSQDELAMAQRSIGAGGGGVISAASLLERYGESNSIVGALDSQTDRGWIFGHIVVDEAQELSHMQWRMVFRRAPSKSVTIVGDLAQTSAPAGAHSWQEMLAPFVGKRWQQQQLTINYRTPKLIMDSANRMLRNYGVTTVAGAAVRAGSWPVTASRIDLSAAQQLATLVADVATEVATGTLAIITPQALVSLCEQVKALIAEQAELQTKVRISVLTPTQSKGLEFDTVVVVEPNLIAEATSHPGQELYVAMTRPTQRLAIAYSENLPPELYSSLPESL